MAYFFEYSTVYMASVCIFVCYQDKKCDMKIHKYVDEVIRELCTQLGVELPEWHRPTVLLQSTHTQKSEKLPIVKVDQGLLPVKVETLKADREGCETVKVETKPGSEFKVTLNIESKEIKTESQDSKCESKETKGESNKSKERSEQIRAESEEIKIESNAFKAESNELQKLKEPVVEGTEVEQTIDGKCEKFEQRETKQKTEDRTEKIESFDQVGKELNADSAAPETEEKLEAATEMENKRKKTVGTDVINCEITTSTTSENSKNKGKNLNTDQPDFCSHVEKCIVQNNLSIERDNVIHRKTEEDLHNGVFRSNGTSQESSVSENVIVAASIAEVGSDMSACRDNQLTHACVPQTGANTQHCREEDSGIPIKIQKIV